ncbi:hypothetical protein TBK1r_68820 [Stieleria magnilauensis]|uniref:Uncharacterized protein n=1 Tax=Stieleria magnilauensis TaxID=2527963 RepID=A0ABX5Y3V8_9BACT|nr:hypothetical protein TBK1r_68820 [Planctomycetes bacterium TBK1r]
MTRRTALWGRLASGNRSCGPHASGVPHQSLGSRPRTPSSGRQPAANPNGVEQSNTVRPIHAAVCAPRIVPRRLLNPAGVPLSSAPPPGVRFATPGFVVAPLCGVHRRAVLAQESLSNAIDVRRDVDLIALRGESENATVLAAAPAPFPASNSSSPGTKTLAPTVRIRSNRVQ